MSVDRVRRWRDQLRATDPAPRSPLSDAGIRAAWTVALDALHDDALDAAMAIPGTPFTTAAMAVAHGVLTAPIEWCAVLLARGTQLVLKPPADQPGLVPLLVETAQRVGLPLTARSDRGALDDVELVIAMGTTETADQVRRSHLDARVLAFGHRFSVAWITDPASFAGIARDAALHDGRGCMSPVVVGTPLALDVAVDALGAAMATLETEIPRGDVLPVESARIRSRRALALAAGVLREGPGWSVHGLPSANVVPAGLPRSLVVHRVADREAFVRWLSPWASAVSTLGTDDPSLTWDGARVTSPGEMQRPPLVRLHDGVDWLRATLR